MLSLLLFNTVQEILDIAIIQEKYIKGIHTDKEEVKISPFADNMVLYIENPINSTKNPTRANIINKLSKFAGVTSMYKKSVVFLCQQ